ncbi:MAG TPA: hypothetical protein ENG74_04015 [Thermoplasmatales archaeon]|nr:hypothetical protein [Thermoplasmatales archaeon]
MNKKLMGFGVSLLFILTIFSPAVTSRSLDHQESVTVEVNKIGIRGIKKVLTKLSYDEACKLRELLIRLDEALSAGNLRAVRKYESEINGLGIFGDGYQKIPVPMAISSTAVDVEDDNISNTLCYFHAAGRGTIYFTFTLKLVEMIKQVVKNATSLIGALAVIIAMIAIFAPIIILTYIVPFRIAMPVGMVRVENGSVSSFGTRGYKKVEVEENETFDVNISWFTGITINIAFNKSNESGNFLFVSGFALAVEEGEL